MLKSLKMLMFISAWCTRYDVNRNQVGPLCLFRTPLPPPLPPPACRVTLARSSAHTHVNMPQLCSDKDPGHSVTDSDGSAVTWKITKKKVGFPSSTMISSALSA